MLKNPDCFFCQEMEDRRKNILSKDRVIWDTKHFVVFPTEGCFVVGYLLIMPKAHYLCFGELSPEQFKEVQSIICRIGMYIRQRINQGYVLFEHGTRDLSKLTSTSIMHAHMHIIPFQGDFLQSLPEGCSVKSIPSLSALTCTRENYLYFRNTDGVDYLVESDNYPSQFFRRVICNALRIPQYWNWMEYPFKEQMEATLKFFDELCLNS